MNGLGAAFLIFYTGLAAILVVIPQFKSIKNGSAARSTAWPDRDTALILSLIPGLGSIYLKEFKKGLLLIFSFSFIILLLISIIIYADDSASWGITLTYAGVFYAIWIWMTSAVETTMTACGVDYQILVA